MKICQKVSKTLAYINKKLYLCSIIFAPEMLENYIIDDRLRYENHYLKVAQAYERIYQQPW